MKRLLFAALLVFATLAQASYRDFELIPLAARTASGNGSSLDSLADQLNWTDVGGILLTRVTAVSGTSPSLTTGLECIADDGAVYTLVASSAITTVSTVVTQVPRVCKIVRSVWAISGTTPSFTFSMRLIRQ